MRDKNTETTIDNERQRNRDRESGIYRNNTIGTKIVTEREKRDRYSKR